MSEETASPIREFVTGRYPQVPIADDDDIFRLGFVNSLFAMELVMFLEKRFAVAIPNSELRMDNFRSVASMTALIEGSRALAAAGRATP